MADAGKRLSHSNRQDPDEAVPFEAIKLAALDLRQGWKVWGCNRVATMTKAVRHGKILID